jgi:hypothetical protein
MAVTFTTSPFEVIAGNDAGIVIEDRKTGQSWQLSNQQAREFGQLIGRRPGSLSTWRRAYPARFREAKPNA